MNSDNPYGFCQRSTNIVEYQGEIRKRALFLNCKKKSIKINRFNGMSHEPNLIWNTLTPQKPTKRKRRVCLMMAIQASKCIQRIAIVKCQTVDVPPENRRPLLAEVLAKFYDSKSVIKMLKFTPFTYYSYPKKYFKDTTHSHIQMAEQTFRMEGVSSVKCKQLASCNKRFNFTAF